MSTTVFDPEKFKESTRQQWQNAAKAWNDWGVFLRQWLGPATQHMLDMARVGDGSRGLGVAGGGPGPTEVIGERGGAEGAGFCTKIFSHNLKVLRENTR